MRQSVPAIGTGGGFRRPFVRPYLSAGGGGAVLLALLLVALLSPAFSAPPAAVPVTPVPEPIAYGLLRDPYDVAVSPNGRTVAVAESSQDGRSGAVRLFQVTDSGILRPHVYVTRRAQGPRSKGALPSIMAVAFSPDGATLAAAALTGEVFLLSAATPSAAMRALPIPRVRPAAYTLAFSGQDLIVGYGDGIVRLWRGVGRRRIDPAPRMVTRHRGRVLSVRVARGWVISGGEDRRIRWTRLSDGAGGAHLYSGPVSAVAAGAAGIYAAGTVKNARLLYGGWSASGQPGSLRTLPRRLAADPITSLTPIDSHAALLVGYDSGRLEIVDTRAPVSPGRVLSEHAKKVRAIAAPPGAAWFVTVHRDKALRLWPRAAEYLRVGTGAQAPGFVSAPHTVAPPTPVLPKAAPLRDAAPEPVGRPTPSPWTRPPKPRFSSPYRPV